MLRFIAKRFLEAIPVLFIVATLTFFMMKMSAGHLISRTPQPLKSRRPWKPSICLNKPHGDIDYMKKIVHDFGPPLNMGWTVRTLSQARFPSRWNSVVTRSRSRWQTDHLPVSSRRPARRVIGVPMSIATLGILFADIHHRAAADPDFDFGCTGHKYPGGFSNRPRASGDYARIVLHGLYLAAHTRRNA